MILYVVRVLVRICFGVFSLCKLSWQLSRISTPISFSCEIAKPIPTVRACDENTMNKIAKAKLRIQLCVKANDRIVKRMWKTAHQNVSYRADLSESIVSTLVLLLSEK